MLMLTTQALLEALGEVGLSEERDPIEPLARAFLQMAPFFKLYTQYCQNYDNLQSVVHRCAKDSKNVD